MTDFEAHSCEKVGRVGHSNICGTFLIMKFKLTNKEFRDKYIIRNKEL